jgi:tensin
VSSVGESGEFGLQTSRFVRDTSKIWHKPNITREEAINLLKDKPAGTFIVRNSSSFHGSYGLAVKVAQLPPNVHTKGGDPQVELVRHFLIETTSKGVRLKGCNNEPTFGSLAALVYQHSITPLALPCKLLLPDLTEMMDDIDASHGSLQVISQGAAWNVIYVNSIDVESLTGQVAVAKAIERTFAVGRNPPNTTIVNFKLTSQAIILTDNNRKVFFRRHYPITSVTYCGLDSHDRRWTLNVTDTQTTSGRVFGFVARKTGSITDNACHLFAELDSNQPASAIVSCIEKVLIGLGQ